MHDDPTDHAQATGGLSHPTPEQGSFGPADRETWLPAEDPAPEQSAPAPASRETWLPAEDELPPRPRKRLLTPLPVALLAVLMVACGFIAGVLVEKGQGSSGGEGSAGGGGLASRLSALAGSAGGRAGAGGGRGGLLGDGSSGSATVGQVAFVDGSDLYMTNAEGNTVKVLARGATVSKTVSASVHSIHPGETVVVTGSAGSGGAVRAEAIRVGGGGGGAIGSLFGGGAGSGGVGGKGSLDLFGGG